MKKAKLIKLSICKCGFPLLKDEIKLGAIYKVDPDRRGGGTITCGGCGTVIPCEMIWTFHRDSTKSGWLPEQIFTLQSNQHEKALSA